MAQKEPYVLLGYVDEMIDGDSQTDFSANKIGGNADWINLKDSSPSCIMCSRSMILVLQLYTPVTESLNHRTLYLFACVTPECWNKPHSWICLRSEIPPKEIKKETTSSTPAFECPDEWNFNDGNGNVEDSSNYNANSKNKNENILDRNFNSYGDVEISNLTQSINLNQDKIENENVVGAIALQEPLPGCTEPSAMIEGPEDDVISVETPDKCSSDLTQIFQDVARVGTGTNITFLPYYITSDYEYLEDSNFTKREQELMLRLSNRIKDEKNSPTGMHEEEAEAYEKTSSQNMLFYKFTKRVRHNPNQILRYNRDDGLNPLWIRNPESYPRKCRYCSSILIFELQVMPQLLNVLKVLGINSPLIEFGTVLVITCAKSCWNEKTPTREEVVIVQGEP